MQPAATKKEGDVQTHENVPSPPKPPLDERGQSLHPTRERNRSGKQAAAAALCKGIVCRCDNSMADKRAEQEKKTEMTADVGTKQTHAQREEGFLMLEQQEQAACSTSGLSFVTALLWQLDLLGHLDVWDVALHVLYHVSVTPARTWLPFFKKRLSAQTEDERIEEFRKHHGVSKVLQNLDSDAENYDVVLYVLDHCCGIRNSDWQAPRLHCDALFVQAFANWSGNCVRVFSSRTGSDSRLVSLDCILQQ